VRSFSKILSNFYLCRKAKFYAYAHIKSDHIQECKGLVRSFSKILSNFCLCRKAKFYAYAHIKSEHIQQCKGPVRSFGGWKKDLGM